MTQRRRKAVYWHGRRYTLSKSVVDDFIGGKRGRVLVYLVSSALAAMRHEANQHKINSTKELNQYFSAATDAGPGPEKLRLIGINSSLELKNKSVELALTPSKKSSAPYPTKQIILGDASFHEELTSLKKDLRLLTIQLADPLKAGESSFLCVCLFEDC